MLSKRSALLAAIVVALVVVGLLFWPDRARADFGVSARIGGGFGHSHHFGGQLHFGNRGITGGLGFGVRVDGAGPLGRFPGARFLPRGPQLGDRFRIHQRKRITGRKLPSFVHLGDAELFAQRKRLDAKFLGHKRRFLHRKGGSRWAARRWANSTSYASYGALGVPGDSPELVIVQVQVPAPSAPAAQAPAPQPQPLDPRGRIKVVGEEEGVVGDWSQGDVVPERVPVVTLDHVAYGLPLPGLGEKYARVGNDVLRIDAGTRRIIEVVAR